MFTLLRIRFYPFSFRSVLPVHIAPGTFEYAMKTISVHIAPLQVQRNGMILSLILAFSKVSVFDVHTAFMRFQKYPFSKCVFKILRFYSGAM